VTGENGVKFGAQSVRLGGSCASAALLIVVSSACSRSSLPNPDSKQYREFVSAFYVGLAGLQTGEDVRAKEKLTKASEIAPGEPATWYNLALLSVRQQEFDPAYQDAEKGRQLAPDNSRIEQLLGSIESKRGKLPEAVGHLKRAVALDPKNVKALYALAEQTERESTPEGDAEAQKDFERLPGNVAAEVEVARLAAKRGDGASLKKALAELAADSTAWPEEARSRLAAVTESANGPNPRAAAVQASFLRNVLARVAAYRQSLDAAKTPAIFVGEPYLGFIKLPTPESSPAPVDTALTFNSSTQNAAAADWASAIALDASGKFTAISAGADGISISGGAKLPLPGHPKVADLTRFSIAAADLNYDFKTDLVIATPAGVRIYEQQTPANFTDITPGSKLPSAIVNGAYTGAWPFDVDLDGDLDIVLGSRSGEPVVLRNNGDNTFATVRPFNGINGTVAFAAADLDGDGDPDVALIDGTGALHVFNNERLGEFKERALPAGWRGRFASVVIGDVNADGMPDVVAMRDNGSVVRLSDKNYGEYWETAEIAKPAPLSPATANLLIGDFDNNGAMDIYAGDGRLFLGDAHGFTEVKGPTGITATAAVDLNDDGHLTISGVSAGKAVTAESHGTKNYKWQTIRLHAAQAHGDQRINSFGIGGEVEIRSGLLTQKQVITAPALHFGLGTHTDTDVARIIWPNGSLQAEFELHSDQSILAEQRLKGSCPSLFAWDGKRMSFIKDGAPWSPALGLHINAQKVAGISQTEEWFKIPGSRMVPRDGKYDVRVTAELWETFYIDRFAMLAVDHPKGTEVFTDERFSVPPPALKVYTVKTPQPFASATDDCGMDVSATVRDADAKYLDTFGRGKYQGVTRDHWVELGLPENAPRTGKLYLLGYGWMHPTDATVNIAMGQGSGAPPKSLSIEVPDAHGRWIVAKSDLGFLAGKLKTAVFDISDVFQPGAPRKLRLRTNMEIYWDQLSWAEGAADSQNQTTTLSMTKAELRYRGFSIIRSANSSSPETPDYNHLEGAAQKWRDLEGYYTRYGDVRELLAGADDRFVITNAGDEIRMEFTALPEPRQGLVRDFVMIGNGWIKDGDYNSTYSKTVLPLPYRAMKDYSRAPGTLEDEPAYRLHPGDWDTFHTRYITPDLFIRALRN
jgi:hypothetical protein